MPELKDYLSYEKERNIRSTQLFTDILREAFGKDDEVIVLHHLTFMENSEGDEIPSADTLIFDHDIAKKIWGESKYLSILQTLAMTPVENREAVLGSLYYGRSVDQIVAALSKGNA